MSGKIITCGVAATIKGFIYIICSFQGALHHIVMKQNNLMVPLIHYLRIHPLISSVVNRVFDSITSTTNDCSLNIKKIHSVELLTLSGRTDFKFI